MLTRGCVSIQKIDIVFGYQKFLPSFPLRFDDFHILSFLYEQCENLCDGPNHLKTSHRKGPIIDNTRPLQSLTLMVTKHCPLIDYSQNHVKIFQQPDGNVYTLKNARYFETRASKLSPNKLSFKLMHVVWRKCVDIMKIISHIYFKLVEVLINMDLFLTQERIFFLFNESPRFIRLLMFYT